MVETDLLVLVDETKKSNEAWRKHINFFNETCQIPQFNFDDQVKSTPSKPCKIAQNPGYIKDNVWHLYENTKSKYPSLKCSYREIERVDDFKTKAGDEKLLVDGQRILDEVFEVKCFENKDRSNFRFSSVFAQIVSKLNGTVDNNENILHKPDANNCSPLNVMLLSYDSVSRVSWINRLPLTHKFITEKMNFDIINGYNIVGDGTPAGMYQNNLFLFY